MYLLPTCTNQARSNDTPHQALKSRTSTVYSGTSYLLGGSSQDKLLIVSRLFFFTGRGGRYSTVEVCRCAEMV